MTAKALMASSGKCVVWTRPMRQMDGDIKMEASKHMPVAFVTSMQFWRVMHMLPQLKIYKPKKK